MTDADKYEWIRDHMISYVHRDNPEAYVKCKIIWRPDSLASGSFRQMQAVGASFEECVENAIAIHAEQVRFRLKNSIKETP